MKKITMLLLVTFGLYCAATAQDKKLNETKVSKFAAGTTLSKNDVGFLDLISGSNANKSRGSAGVTETKLGGKTFTEGQKLTKEDIATINKASKDYAKANADIVTKDKKVTANKSRGCYYDTCYYYYWDYSCGCYVYYWYCC